MRIDGNNFYTTNTVRFNGTEINENFVIEAFNFAWDMSFGKRGKHRNHRTGGNRRRANGEIFIDTFQGKLSEFASYQKLTENGIDVPYPDLETYELGRWDNYDFLINDNLISIKSTKHFGNLLLLETGDWSNDGRYIPNINDDNRGIYDYFVLVRISPSAESILKKNRLLYNSTCDKEKLEDLIISEDWEFDIPGFIDNNYLLDVIQDQRIIPQNALLNPRYYNDELIGTEMDADNYYIETGEMNDIEELFDLL